MTRSEFEEICRATCPHCQADVQRQQPSLRQRHDTMEWVHDIALPQHKTVAHTFCFASYLRNSQIAKDLSNA